MLTKRIKLFSAVLIASVMLAPGAVSAHNSFVVLNPVEANYGTLTRFTITTTMQAEDTLQTVKVMLPEGLRNVSGVVNAGWQVTTTTEYVQWQGALSKGQTVDLTFSAVTPRTGDTVPFKMFRNYSSGLADEHEFAIALSKRADDKNNIVTLPLALSMVGVVLGATALVVSLRKNSPKTKKRA